MGPQQFANEVQAVINRYTYEADLSYAEMIGALEILKTKLAKELLD